MTFHHAVRLSLDTDTPITRDAWDKFEGHPVVRFVATPLGHMMVFKDANLFAEDFMAFDWRLVSSTRTDS